MTGLYECRDLEASHGMAGLTVSAYYYSIELTTGGGVIEPRRAGNDV